VKGATKSFQLVLQAFIMKQLLFEGKQSKRTAKDKDKKKPPKTKEGFSSSAATMNALLRPNEMTQREILAGAIADLLWKVGDKEQAVLVVPEANPVFEPSVRFAIDGLTEKLHIFKCKKEEELKSTVKKHVFYFLEEKGGGLACLLYSIVLSKGFTELKSEMQDQADLPLVDVEDKITICLAALLFTATATPYLHNGIVAPDDGDADNYDFGDGKVGIISRNEIGLLMWDTDEVTTEKINLGSRLKTPVIPIWITCVNGNWGVLFNPNRDLMKSHAAENRFNLYYYSNGGAAKEKRDTILLIDTRMDRIAGTKVIQDNDDLDQLEENPVEKAIQTKWEGASVDWQGVAPYF